MPMRMYLTACWLLWFLKVFRKALSHCSHTRQQTFREFKAALRSFKEKETERARTATSDDSVMKTVHESSRVNNGAQSVAKGSNRDNVVCHGCKQSSHIARFCENKPKLWWASVAKHVTHTDTTCRNKSKTNEVSKDKVHIVSTVYGRLGDSVGRQQEPRTPNSATGMQECYHMTSRSAAIIWRSHTKLIYLAN